MYNDIECPYCGKGLDINHDDGYGYEENTIHQQICKHCGKTFIYTTAIIFQYEAEKAPCLNGKPHKWKAQKGYPSELHEGKYTCECCGEEKVDWKVHEAALKRYEAQFEKEA